MLVLIPSYYNTNYFFAALPIIIGTNITQNPQIGESFFIECNFTGLPIPTVVWKKDGDELDEFNDDSIKIICRDNSSYLKIIGAIDTSFNGLYECNITNVVGSISQSFQIKLQGQLVT